MGRILQACVFLVAVVIASCTKNYVITLPREFVGDEATQICVWVSDASSPAGSITMGVNHTTSRYNEPEVKVILPPTTIDIPPGKVEFCENIVVPSMETYYGVLSLVGHVAGVKVNHTGQVVILSSPHQTILQTDKYLYQSGQTVHFRMLTVDGPRLTVSKAQYPEVWVMSPSNTRIAQWLDVDNSGGLVHLNMTLADEPEKGLYTIQARRQNTKTSSVNFKVEDYVLPRFEVTVKTPTQVLATDSQFSTTVCAKYTFGEAVNGNLSLEVSNSKARGCKVVYNITDSLSGCKTIVIESPSVRMIDCSVNNVHLTARVTEHGSGVQLSAMGRVKISQSPVNFVEVYKDNYLKTNLPYYIKVRAELPDKTPARHIPVEFCAGDTCSNITVPEDGNIAFYISSNPIKKVQMKALITRAPLNGRSDYYSTSLERYYSPSNSSLHIHAPEEEIYCSQTLSGSNYNLPVLFSVTGQTTANITVQVISRRSIQYTATREYELSEGELPIRMDQMLDALPTTLPGTVRGVLNIPIKLPITASPTARVLVWMVRRDGEVVSDVRELKVEPCLANRAELSWSHSKLQPGEVAQLKLKAAPNSLCSLGVVDKSVELLNTQSDPFDLPSLFRPLADFKVRSWSGQQVNDYQYCRDYFRSNADDSDSVNYRYFTEYVDALKMFDDAGLYIFSNLRVETRPCEKQEHAGNIRFGGNNHYGGTQEKTSFATRITFSDSPGRIETFPEPVEEPRTDFPETWLWDITLLPSSGELSQTLTLPDTITQWIGKAVCVHPEEGIGLTQKVNITTFTPFFLDLTLPPSMKRGEILSVKISLFNYLHRPLPVAVTVYESTQYEIVDGVDSARIQDCVPRQNKVVMVVKIKPTALGQVNITVGAVVNHQYPEACGTRDTSINRRDTLIKPITVEAEGFPRETTRTKYICTRDLEEGSDALETWEVAAPTSIVQGSDRGWVTVVGDLLALTLENLGHLIRMPTGCGEQNMLNFAPNVFILQYLEATQQEEPEAADKLLRYMRTGYQRQLLYKRGDGSYSAFGSADESGSTWLTAFVAKSFAMADSFILIDNTSLSTTLEWLKNTQGEDGCFETVGKAVYKVMKVDVGEKETRVPLTAYVLISLLEAGEEPGSSAVTNATICLNSYSTHDPYTLALKAYALALAQNAEAQIIMQQLMNKAIVRKNSTHWELHRTPGFSNVLAVETAGYAVLAMMALDPRGYDQPARKVIKWITAQRNGRGGFYSTQDTVVALQAMASYESQQYQGDVNLVATVKGTDLHHSFAVDETNNLLTQLVPLPGLPNTLHLSIVGQGCAVLQSVLRYNVLEAEASDAFILSVGTNTLADKNCVTKNVKACVTYVLPDGKSNMAVMEINLISGYIPDKEDLKAIVSANNTIKRYEVDGSKISLYIDEITREQLCVNLRALREVEVEDYKPGSVILYDYYQPEFSVRKTYRFPPTDECRYAW
ncbi:hypothetical protein Pmani_011444 [Petrolisthes manimaculis]|uniref:Alpha-2-macroglobulin n=1 Tax=Petrolisthes manimaculis TaxID=1843537 RepID=A0AAE1UEE2_9EUCA|nr:hypothetical protein Pmani_011444 [Petrolisthes manimaculis]